MPDNPFRLLFRSQAGPLLALIVIVLCFGLADLCFSSGGFFTWRNLRVLSNSGSLIAVPALGMTLIIIAGGIDLSAGTALTLSGTVLAVLLKASTVTNEQEGFAMMIAGSLLATLVVGCLCGVVNGVIITMTQVVPFIVTLGTMTIFLGIGQIVSEESTVYPPKDHLPGWLDTLCYTGSNSDRYALIPYVPTSLLFALVLSVLVGLVLRFTVFGRNVYAIGSSAATARLCGINVSLNKIAVYSLAGVFIAFGGLLYFADVKNGNPSDGLGEELEMIAAVVLGGGSLAGGRGSILGTVVGAFIIVVIRNGCSLLDIPDTYTKIIIGVIIIVAVIVDQLRHGSPEWLFRMFSKLRTDA